jgi:hypothetical protein
MSCVMLCQKSDKIRCEKSVPLTFREKCPWIKNGLEIKHVDQNGHYKHHLKLQYVKYQHVQGGAINPGLLFAGLPPTWLGRLRGAK